MKKSNYSKHSNLFGVVSLSFCAGLLSLGFIDIPEQTQASEEFISPCDECTYAVVEMSGEEIATGSAEAGQSLVATSSVETKEEIEAYIYEVFGKDGDDAVKMATCESGLNPEQIGDKHLLAMLDGELVGDSIGLFQIRTGDAGVYDSKPWNRAKANGMTVDEFRVWMKNPKENVDYAKKMFDRQGWGQWHNCMKKVGI